MTMQRMWTALLPVVIMIVTGCAHAGRVHEYQLENGMKLVVKEDHRAPVAVSQLWYKVGSSYEANGRTGVAHILEHMMFKGTERVPDGEFSKRVANAGGRDNAFTSRDYTVYFQQVEKSKLPLVIELEADRMANLTLSAEELAKELLVIMEERRWRTDDKPMSLAYERFNATAYMSSPYRHPVIGWPEDIQATTIEDLAGWYNTWYAPNNATLVIVGDVDPDATHKLVKQHYGVVPKRDVPVPKPQHEIQQLGARNIDINVHATLEYLMIGYKVPSAVTADVAWEPYALLVMASVLDGGASARFSRELVRTQRVAANAFASYSPWSRMETMLMFGGVPSQGTTLADFEKALREQIALLLKDGISAEELARVKAQVLASTVYEQDSLYYQTMEIGMLETLGLGWKLGEKFTENVQQVTVEQVLAVANKYIKAQGETVARLKPLAQEGK